MDRPRTMPPSSGLERIWRLENLYGYLARWGLLLAGALAIWGWQGFSFVAGRPWGVDAYVLAGYAALNMFWMLLLALLRWRARRRHAPGSPFLRRALLTFTFLLDQLLVACVIWFTGGFQSEFYLLLALLAFKAALYYPGAHELAFVSFLSGPLWVAAAYQGAGSLFFLADRAFLVRYGVLFGVVVGCLVVGWLLERQQQRIATLGATLSLKSDDLADQATIVQRTAGELANRLLELRSLQEGVKAINSSLALDELLQRIVENATQVLRGARCTIALVDEEARSVVTLAAAGVAKDDLWCTAFHLGQGVAGWVVQHQQPALIHSVQEDSRFQPMGNWPVESLLSVPLISENRAIGALTATSPQRGAFSEADASLLDAFGDQAVVAVKNARLYEQLKREEEETARLYQSVLEKSNELEAILRGIGDGVIVIDPQLGLLMMNPVAAHIFGVVQAPKPGVRLPEIVPHEALLALARETLAEAAAPLIRELTLEDRGDRAQIYQALASTVQGADGQTRGVVMVLRDVTSQKEIERMKSDFLSVVSHELRTPLHSIKGFVEIILMGKTGEINARQRDFLTTVKEATSNLQRLIDDLLEFSRMEAGQVKLKPELISLYQVAEKVVEQLAPLSQESGLILANQIPANLELVEADPLRIEQVLSNLVSNACKFTPSGGSITIGAEDAGAQVRVWVQDTGIGISEGEQAKIFQRFYQVDSSATRSYRGAGLGLTISRFIIEYHHGRIWVESAVGQGSTFYFLLPKQLPKDEALVIDFTIPAARRGGE